MSGLVMATIVTCDYCNESIDYSTEPAVETRIVDDRVEDAWVVQITHRKCWIAIDVVTKTIIQSARELLKGEVDNKSPAM